MISQSVTSSEHGGRRTPPWVFTEHGALMVATILNSNEAAAMSVYVIRAFVKMREQITANNAMLNRLAEVEKTLLQHDNTLWDIYQKLIPLLAPIPEDPKKKRLVSKPKNPNPNTSEKRNPDPRPYADSSFCLQPFRQPGYISQYVNAVGSIN